jgi:hypothetical protein
VHPGAVRIERRIDAQIGRFALQTSDPVDRAHRVHGMPGALRRIAGDDEHGVDAGLGEPVEQRERLFRREVHRAQVGDGVAHEAPCHTARIPAAHGEAQQIGDVHGVHGRELLAEHAEFAFEGFDGTRHQLDGETTHGGVRYRTAEAGAPLR